MKPPAVVQRHRSLRWLVPVVVVGVAGLAATGMLRAGATSESLPPTTPTALLAQLQATRSTGFSGTVVSQLSLGLPELPSIGSVDSATPMTSLLSGSHTLQVWYGGRTEQRVALLGATDETDLFRSGRQLWQWSSADRVAIHTVLPPDRAGQSASSSAAATLTPSSLTPSGLAERAIAAIDPTTRVSVEDDRVVADRSAYEMVLAPRGGGTRIGSVHIFVDGATKVPLGVQVFARGATNPAVDVAFTSVRFSQPADTYFHFSPPADATVHQESVAPTTPAPSAAPRSSRSSGPLAALLRNVSVSGAGWSSVLGLHGLGGSATTFDRSALARALTPVAGSWGKGRLLDSPLLCVLVTDDGRVYAGAVDPSALYAAADGK